jgi:integrase
VYAGENLVTGKRVYRSETVQGTDLAAEKKPGKVLTRLLADVDAQRAPTSSASLAYLLGELLRRAEPADTTRRTCVGDIDRTTVPAIGSEPIDKLSARTSETPCSELRRCRTRCDGRPYIEKHKTDEVRSRAVTQECRRRAITSGSQTHSPHSPPVRTVITRWKPCEVRRYRPVPIATPWCIDGAATTLMFGDTVICGG